MPPRRRLSGRFHRRFQRFGWHQDQCVIRPDAQSEDGGEGGGQLGTGRPQTHTQDPHEHGEGKKIVCQQLFIYAVQLPVIDLARLRDYRLSRIESLIDRN